MALKTKYSVAKIRQDFVRLDKEWNEFKVTDEKAGPDKIFALVEGIDKSKLVPYQMNEAHDKLGHFGEVRLRKMTNLKGLRLIGKLTACDACGLIITKASPIAKSSSAEKKSKEIGERLYVDITGPFPLTGGKWHTSIRYKMFWYGMSDEFSGKMISSFQYEKSTLVDMVAETFDYFKGRDHKVKHLRMDNAGENQAVERLCKSQNITVEYTPPDMPKLNQMVEWGFTIRWEGAKVLMQIAGLKPEVKRNKIILVEAIKTVVSFFYEEGPRKGKELSINYAGGFIGSHSKKIPCSPFFGVEVSTIMSQ